MSRSVESGLFSGGGGSGIRSGGGGSGVPANSPFPIGVISSIDSLNPTHYITMDDTVFTNNGDGSPGDWSTSSTSLVSDSNFDGYTSFAGAGYVSAAGSTATGQAGSTTVSAFIKPTLGTTMAVYNHGNNPVSFSNREFYFIVEANGSLTYRIFHSGTSTTWTTAAGVVTDGIWQMVSAVFQASVAGRIYVNGVEVLDTATGQATKNTGAVCTASWGATSNSSTGTSMGTPVFPFIGGMAHGFVDNTAVSEATLLAIYQEVL